MNNVITCQTEEMRLNKFLAQSGICSRRDGEELILAGRVLVDGLVATIGQKISNGQKIEVIGEIKKEFSILFHKPIGIVSAQAQKNEIPAIRLITEKNKIGEGEIPPNDISIPALGRLDKDSRGLLILSEDGVLAKAIISPQSEIDKEYEVEVLGLVSDEKLKKLRFGLSLDGRKLQKAKVEEIAPQKLRFILKEGRKRQIRRMCDLVGLKVVDLLRVRVGPIKLGDLKEGFWRHLTESEKSQLKNYHTA